MRRPAATLAHVTEGEACLAPTERRFIRDIPRMVLRRGDHASPCGNLGTCDRGRGMPRPYGREIHQGNMVAHRWGKARTPCPHGSTRQGDFCPPYMRRVWC